jgi:predicted RNA-binding protein with PUA-like domain
MPTRHWICKSEPDVYSIDDLERDGSTGWDGVRNYQARNFMRDSMRPGDRVLVWHSNADPAGVAGVAKVAGAPRPDPTQFERESPYFDRGSDPDDPTWVMVDVVFVSRFREVIPLDQLRAEPALSGMLALKRGNRLSVTPVTPQEFESVLRLSRVRKRV